MTTTEFGPDIGQLEKLFNKPPVALLTPVQDVHKLHHELIDEAKDSLKKAARIGEILCGIKIGLQHGEWLPWIACSLDFDRRTASNYMRIHNTRDKWESVSHLGLNKIYELLVTKTEPEDDEPIPSHSEGVEPDALEADSVEPPAVSWQKPVTPTNVPAPIEREPDPPGKATAPRPIPDDIDSIPPLTEADHEWISDTTCDFYHRLINRFHEIDQLDVLDEAIFQLEEMRKDLKDELSD